MKIGIIGAGALGLTAAYELAKKGHSVTVFEKESRVGGLAVDFEYGGWHLEKFYHHIFKTDTDIIDLIEELGLGKDLIWKKPLTSVYYQGNIYRIDNPVSVLQFSPISFFDRLRLGLVMLYLKLQPNYKVFDGQTAVFWLKKFLGINTFKVLWEPILKAKFGTSFDKIAMGWFWARVHYRTQELGYLKGGFYKTYLALEKKVKDLGGAIEYNASIKEIKSKDSRVTIELSDKKFDFDKCLVTIPTQVFAKLTPQVGDLYSTKYQSPDYFGAQCLILQTDRKVLEPYWINMNDVDSPFMAYIEHTNFMDTSDYNGSHLIYLGNYFPATDSKFALDEKEVFKTCTQYLKKLNPEFDNSWVKKYWLFRVPFAQPIVGIDYEKNIPLFKTPLDNVYLANMSQVYPQDRGQNYSIKLAKRVVRVLDES